VDEVLLGLDIGTSSSKGILARPDGTIVAQAERPHRVSLPQPGWVEHDAIDVWWHGILTLCRELIPQAGNGLRGVCVSGIGPCLLPCDRNLQPLRPAILYGVDTRASDEIRELDRELGSDQILERGGSVLSSQALGPKILWLRKHEPDVWTNTAGIYMASSFIVAKLTGEYVLDHQSASQCNPVYDLDANRWAVDWSELIAPGLTLPRLAWPAEIAGSVTDSGSRSTGIPAGTPVVVGTVDAWAEAFSVGVREPGDLMVMYGSTMFLVQVVGGRMRHPKLWTTAAIEPERVTLAAGMATSGSLTAWFKELAGSASYSELVDEARSKPAGSAGLLMLPYFAGERSPLFDADARGIVAGLTLSHGRGHFFRAIYEAIAYGVKHNVATIAAVSGRPTRVTAVGGGTQGDLWTQVVSDVTGLTQRLPAVTVGASYGDALLAAIGSGLVPSNTDWTRVDREIVPNPAVAESYSEMFDLYLQLHRATIEISHKLADIQSRPWAHKDSRRRVDSGLEYGE
jgi:xylulokinase